MPAIQMEAEAYTPAPSASEYQPVIDFAVSLEGSGQVAKFTIPSADVDKTKRILRELAAKAERSVRFKTEDAEEGQTLFRVWTIPPVKRLRKSKTETPEVAETPKTAAKK